MPLVSPQDWCASHAGCQHTNHFVPQMKLAFIAAAAALFAASCCPNTAPPPQQTGLCRTHEMMTSARASYQSRASIHRSKHPLTPAISLKPTASDPMIRILSALVASVFALLAASCCCTGEAKPPGLRPLAALPGNPGSSGPCSGSALYQVIHSRSPGTIPWFSSVLPFRQEDACLWAVRPAGCTNFSFRWRIVSFTHE